MSPALPDPAANAAALLRRLGFAILMIGVPVTALFARRAVVVLAPLGIVLLILASIFDGAARPAGPMLRRMIFSPTGLAMGLVLLWCALSLLWTPFLAEASERLLNILGLVAVTVAGTLALPDRMRSANLYLLPVGVTVAAFAAIVVVGLDPRPPADEEGQNVERGLLVLVLLLWPAAAWLVSRGRRLEAGILGLLVALAALLAPRPLPFQGLVVGAAAFALTMLKPAVGSRVTATAMAGLLVFAPLLPIVLAPIAAGLLDPQDETVAALVVWRDLVLGQPARLVTGHGFETTLRGKVFGLLSPQAPATLLFEVWYELGLVGVVAGAVALAAGAHRAGRDHPLLMPGMMASFATAFGFACFGIGIAQIWWLTTLAIVALLFAATERGQFRTTRPKAFIHRR